MPPPVTLCAVGLKGRVVVDSLLAWGVLVDRIASYQQRNDQAHSFPRIQAAAREAGVDFVEVRFPAIEPDGLAVLVGWQHLLKLEGSTLVILHDSLLPRYRGFAPTVNALIAGEGSIGVTALIGTENFDEGPIIGQRRQELSYPVRIADALERQAALMAELAAEVIGRFRSGGIEASEQDGAAATYSIWRDEDDFWIDWTADAGTIQRFVDAVGFPYSGARTRMGGETIVVRQVTPLRDLAFTIRHPGKIWQIRDGRPTVVCGSGLIRVDEAESLDGAPVPFTRLRARLG